MAKDMKNSQNKVEVQMILWNLVGNEYETVDFWNRMFKWIYSEIKDKRNQEAL